MTAARLAYPHRRRGLDHDCFSHQPVFKRPPLTWPGGKRIALWITVPVEFFPLDAPPQPFRPLGGLDRGYPDFWSYSHRDYGNRIGIYRIMRVLDGLAVRATAAINASVCMRYPRVVDEVLRRDWEIVANGLDMGHVHHGGLAIEKERVLIQEARDALVHACGKPIKGWHSPGHSQSAHTLQLLCENEFEYVADWANDDLPYMMKAGEGLICAMPMTYEWADRFLLAHHNLTVEDYEMQAFAAFRHLMAEAEQHSGGRVLSLSISPWILGYPHRIGGLERMLDAILKNDAVWPATGIEIVSAFRAQCSQ
jgi:peptidoglycan/xylan/chitin deacetylase (PgdA/CDA1 family)